MPSPLPYAPTLTGPGADTVLHMHPPSAPPSWVSDPAARPQVTAPRAQGKGSTHRLRVQAGRSPGSAANPRPPQSSESPAQVQGAAQGERGAAAFASSSRSTSTSSQKSPGGRRGAPNAPRTGRAILSGARRELRAPSCEVPVGRKRRRARGAPLGTRLRAEAWPPAQVLFAAAPPALSGPPVPGPLRSARREPQAARPSGATRPCSLRNARMRARVARPALVLLPRTGPAADPRARQVPPPPAEGSAAAAVTKALSLAA